MKPHKWAREIHAWADGAEIEQKQSTMKQWVEFDGDWLLSDCWEYRIKPQPFLGMKEIPYKDWVLRFYKMPNDLCYTEGINDEWMNEMVEAIKPQPKEDDVNDSLKDFIKSQSDNIKAQQDTIKGYQEIIQMLNARLEKEQPKEPQYLYVLMNASGRIEFHEKMYPPTVYIGKIKLEE